MAQPEQVKRRIDSLRSQLRSIGSVDASVLAEYREVAERHRFLTEQSADLENAAKSLRRGITELERLIREQFEQSFGAVAAAFSRYFSALFAGGSAKLVLTDPHNVAESGVDIIAQPPGRRAQSLALLSGGERALTSAALLFALLTVRPTPFCVLDEVDAALDEANINRFLEALGGLTSQTQFVVITHNRATMAASGAIYGVTMSADSVSRVLSLRLDGKPGGNGRWYEDGDGETRGYGDTKARRPEKP